MTTSHTRRGHTIGDLLLWRPPSERSKPAEPAKPPEPQIALPAAKQAALREVFKTAGVSDDVAGSFLRRFSEHLDTVEQLAREHCEGSTAFKALCADRDAKHHVREAKRSLDAALEHVAATKHLPTLIARQLHAEDEAIQRIRTRLDTLSRWFTRPKRPGPVPDIYESLALRIIAQLFQEFGLRSVTTPNGLFATVARILVKADAEDVHPRNLMDAIKAAKR